MSQPANGVCSILVHGEQVPRGLTSSWHVTRRYRNDGVGASLKLEVDLRALPTIALSPFQLGWPRALPALTQPAIEDDFDASVRSKPLPEVGIEVGMVTRNDEERKSH